MQNASPCNSGFTLVELSIVLVIIGLIIGGILAGRDLIRAATVRATISQIEKFKSAVNTFKLQYNCIPGDCLNATDYWGTDSSCPGTYSTVPKIPTCNGDGNGDVGQQGGGIWQETVRFWQQLGAANLIPGLYTGAPGPSGYFYDPVININVPSSIYGSNTCVDIINNRSAYTLYPTIYYPAADMSGNTFILGLAQSQNACAGAGLFTIDAYNIDTKIDDGKPGTGSVLTEIPTSTRTPNCATSSNPVTATYNIPYGSPACSLYIQGGF